MIKQKLSILFIVLLSAIWSLRVIQVNSDNLNSKVVLAMNENIVSDELVITPVESHLFSVEEFENYFNVQVQQQEESYIVCLKLQVHNISGKNLNWDNVSEKLGYGFETVTWGSGPDSLIEKNINIFYSEQFMDNDTVDFWKATKVNRNCFRQRNWEHIREKTFWYIMNLAPYSVKIELDTKG